jgi:hypothetical protein
MPSNRREFLTRAARALGSGALCTCTAAAKDLQANVAWPEERFGKALFAKMKWFNEPASATQSGDQLVVRTKPKTDYWRKTFYDYVTDNGSSAILLCQLPSMPASCAVRPKELASNRLSTKSV